MIMFLIIFIFKIFCLFFFFYQFLEASVKKSPNKIEQKNLESSYFCIGLSFAYDNFILWNFSVSSNTLKFVL